MPKNWKVYLKLLLKAYKALHPKRTKSVIFDSSNGSGHKTPDLNGMEIDKAKKSKSKTLE